MTAGLLHPPSTFSEASQSQRQGEKALSSPPGALRPPSGASSAPSQTRRSRRSARTARAQRRYSATSSRSGCPGMPSPARSPSAQCCEGRTAAGPSAGSSRGKEREEREGWKWKGEERWDKGRAGQTELAHS
eukprot:753790-Hanusia_phi.AAC.7